MDVAAENATELPRLGKPRIKLIVQANHTDENSRQFPDPDYQSIIEEAKEKGTNQYESGSATVGRLCAGIWTQGSRRLD
jgi:hypothetical protein